MEPFMELSDPERAIPPARAAARSGADGTHLSSSSREAASGAGRGLARPPLLLAVAQVRLSAALPVCRYAKAGLSSSVKK